MADLSRFDFSVFGCNEEHVRNLLKKMGHTISTPGNGIPGMVVRSKYSGRLLALAPKGFSLFDTGRRSFSVYWEDGTPAWFSYFDEVDILIDDEWVPFTGYATKVHK